jgi:glycerol-3-phosphate dehydrogenase
MAGLTHRQTEILNIVRSSGRFALPALTAELRRNYPFLNQEHASRLAHAYGTRASKLLGGAKSMADLGEPFGATLTAAEIRYLMALELTAEDIVWRHSKLGLRLSAAEIAAIAASGARPENPLREAGARS